MPSSRPGKPRRGPVVAFTATRELVRPVVEGVRGVAGEGRDIAEQASEAGFFADKIFRGGQFHVRRIAFKCRHRQSRPFGKCGVVGEIAAAIARCAAMGVEDDVETKRLRLLRDPQSTAFRPPSDVSVYFDPLTITV